MNKTTHPQIARMVTLFESEEQQFRKVHRMIDLFEVIIKTHTAFIISDYFRIQNVSDNVKGMLAEGLITPSLGIWQFFSQQIMNELALPNLSETDYQQVLKTLDQGQSQKFIQSYNKEGDKHIFIENKAVKKQRQFLLETCMYSQNHKFAVPLTIHGFYSYYFTWEKYVNDIISFRNEYAHGATPTDEHCLIDINKHTPVLIEMLEAHWLNVTSIVVHNEQQQSIELENTISSDLTTNETLIPFHPYLVSKQGKSLDLSPIIAFQKHQETNENILVFFNDLRKKNHVSLLHYPNSLHLREKEIYDNFIEKFPVEDWKTKTLDEFKDRILELTEIFKGRIKEKQDLKNFITKKSRGFYFITGNPGIGKSALIAQVFKEVSIEKEIHGIHFLEYFIRRGTRHSQPEVLLSYLNNRLEQMSRTGIPVGSSTQDMQESLHKRLMHFSENASGKLVIFIDGLDEGIESDKDITKFLIKEDYNNVLLVYGSRSVEKVNRMIADINPELKEKHEIQGLSQNDIRGILYDVADKYSITDEYITSLSEKSEGNPLYLKMICIALEDNAININNIDQLPGSINELYADFIVRYGQHKDGNLLLPALYLFGAAKDYLTHKQLELILKIGPADAENIVNVLQEVLYENPATADIDDYQLFHESFREYMVSKRKSDLAEAEYKIIQYCENWNELDFYDEITVGYPLKYFADHLYNLKKFARLLQLCDDESYIKKQKETTYQFDATFNLYQQAIKAAEGDQEKMFELAIKVGQWHLDVSNSHQQVLLWAKQKDKTSIQHALKRIELFKPEQQIILYTSVLSELLLFDPPDNKKELAEMTLNHLDRNLIKDISVVDWTIYVPFEYMLIFLKELWKLEVLIDPILTRGELGKINIESFDSSEESELLLCEYIIKSITSPINKTDSLIELSKALFKQGKKEDSNKEMEKALFVAEFIKEKLFKIKAFNELIKRYYEQEGDKEIINELINRTLTFIESIIDEERKCNELIDLSMVCYKIGDRTNRRKLLDQIAANIDKVSDQTTKVRILCRLAKSNISIGDKLPNNKLLENALLCTKLIKHDVMKNVSLVRISSVYMDQDDLVKSRLVLDEAIDHHSRINYENDLDFASHNLSEICLKHGEEDLAIKFIETIKDLPKKFKTIVRQGEINFLMGEKQKSKLSFINAYSLLENNTELQNGDSFMELFGIYVNEKYADYDMLLESMLEVEGSEKNETLEFAIMVLNGSHSIKLFEMISSENSRDQMIASLKRSCDNVLYSYLLKQLSYFYLTQGNYTKSQSLLENNLVRIDFNEWKEIYNIIQKLSVTYSEKGKLEHAYNIASFIPSEYEEKEYAICKLAESYLKQGDGVKALSLVDYITNVKSKEYVFEDLVKVSLDEGNIETALTIIESITKQHSKDRSLECLSQFYLKKGNPSRVIEIIETISVLDIKYKCLIDLSKYYLHNDEKNNAAKFLDYGVLIIDSFHNVSMKPNAFGVATEIYYSLRKMDKADITFKKALTQLEYYWDFSSIHYVISDLAKVCLNVWDEKRAFKLADTMDKRFDRKDPVLAEVSKYYLRQGKVDLAIDIIETLTESMNKSTALIELSDVCSENRKIEASDIVLKKLITSAESITDLSIKDKTIQRLSEVYKEKPHNLQSYERFRLMNDISSKSKFISNILKSTKYDELFRTVNKLLSLSNEEILHQSIFESYLIRLVEKPETIEENINNVMPRIGQNMKLMGMALYNLALHHAFVNDNTKQSREKLIELSKVIDIKEWIKKEDHPSYTYLNLNEWIDSIEDEDDREDIESWAKRVEKGKYTEEEFEEKVINLVK